MIRILGVGSPFGADQLAWQAIDHLAGLELEDCELLKLDRPGSGIVSYFHGVDQVVIIDAVRACERPGGVRALDLESLAQQTCLTSSHGFGVVEAIALAGQLDELPSRLSVVGIETGEDDSQLPAIDLPMLEDLMRRLLHP
ncbi:MAG: hydrogenase maturation protease [Candidatus Thiodiazotropha sp.]|nr:MAG: nitrogen fixation protein [gamma proteobacterium symbiont of Ctena orbiculata]